jgi:hypothetical protein
VGDHLGSVMEHGNQQPAELCDLAGSSDREEAVSERPNWTLPRLADEVERRIGYRQDAVIIEMIGTFEPCKKSAPLHKKFRSYQVYGTWLKGRARITTRLFWDAAEYRSRGDAQEIDVDVTTGSRAEYPRP